MKDRLWLAVLGVSVSFVTGAQGGGNTALAQGLKKEKIGSVVFQVSETNRMIHLEFPVKTELSLLHSPSLPADSRYTLTINGEVDSSPGRPEIAQIKARYPGYRFADQSASVAVTGCEVRLSDGSEVECNSPPGTGNYFNVFALLSRRQGDALKAELETKKFPQIRVSLRALDPVVKSHESVRVPVQALYQQISSRERTSVPVLDVIQGAARIAAVELKSVRSPSLYRQAVSLMIQKCVHETLPRPEEIRTLSQLLNVSLRLKAPGDSPVILAHEELEWVDARREGLLEIQSQVVEAE